MMPPKDSAEQPSAGGPGRLGRALMRLLMKHATIVANEPLGGRLRLVSLESPAFRGIDWSPGQKIQIAMGSAFAARTYTPIEWNAVAGRTGILGYTHGDGPGSAWVRTVRPGDECDILGPRRSLALHHPAGPLAVVGDETSIGLACALMRQDRSSSVSCHFEVDDVGDAGPTMTTLGIDAVTTLYGRRPGDGHLAEMEDGLSALVGTGASFVLTGKAGTIQRLRQSLKRHAVPASRIVTKAYWAPGKTGLD